MGMSLLFAQAEAAAENQAFDPTYLIPLLVLFAVAAVAFLLISQFGKDKGKTHERLHKIGKLGAGGSETLSTATTGTERLQELLEKAAPKIARPLSPQTAEEESALKIRLANAGWRSENAPAVYLGIRVFFLLLGVVLAAILVLPQYGLQDKNGILYSIMVIGLCFYIPSLGLAICISKRQEQIFFGLPDALDLMVVCVEAGLGLDAAMRKVCEEMGRTYPIISEEFSICNFQLQMGRPRREVLHDLGVRSGVDDLKSLAAILIQADRFGASIAQALRVQSESMRVRRKQDAEERAAKSAVKLIFPLVLFIFPAVFIVLVGPAAIQIYETVVKPQTGG